MAGNKQGLVHKGPYERDAAFVLRCANCNEPVGAYAAAASQATLRQIPEIATCATNSDETRR